MEYLLPLLIVAVGLTMLVAGAKGTGGRLLSGVTGIPTASLASANTTPTQGTVAGQAAAMGLAGQPGLVAA